MLYTTTNVRTLHYFSEYESATIIERNIEISFIPVEVTLTSSLALVVIASGPMTKPNCVTSYL